jgi:hypothetical protein
MIRVLTIVAAVVALAVSATPASAVSDGTSNTRLAAFTPARDEREAGGRLRRRGQQPWAVRTERWTCP